MKMIRFIVVAMLAAFLLNACKTDVKKTEQKKGDHILAFYNVENLFDTIDDPGVNDTEFTPQAKIPWTRERYKQKLKNIAKALTTMNDGQLPIIIGLCEVENKNVVKDLLHEKPLSNPGYSFIHKNSPDERGIDVAILFDPSFFSVKYAKFIPLPFPFDTTEKTRDILYVKGMLGQDTLHLFVNHWTSRWGGQEETEEFRVHTAGILAGYVDSLEKIVQNPNIIMMGDFNDDPDNISLKETLDAQLVDKKINAEELYNLSYQAFLDGEGSIYWKSWDMFDQFIVSGNLLNKENGIYISPDRQFIHKPDWILYEDNQGVKRPSRTKGKNAYYGGFSDHLPVYIYLNAR